MDNAARLVDCYRQAYRLGEDIIALLQAPPTPASVQRIEELIDERGRLADRAAPFLTSQVKSSPLVREALQQVIEQQPLIEEWIAKVQAHLKVSLAEAGRSRAQMANVTGVLKSRPRPQRINKRT